MSEPIEDVYALIGETVVKFQELELLVSALVIELMKVDYDTGFCITSETSFSRLVTALSSISKVTVQETDLVDEIGILVKRLNESEQSRNTIIHSLYLVVDGRLRRAKTTAKQRKGLEKWLYHTSTEEIKNSIEGIAETKKALLQLVNRLKAKGLVSDVFFSS
jgi:hypothetical protein